MKHGEENRFTLVFSLWCLTPGSLNMKVFDAVDSIPYYNDYYRNILGSLCIW